MSSVPGPSSPSPAETAARLQARTMSDALARHRQSVASLMTSRSGMCMAGGWDVTFDSLDGDFDLDVSVVSALLAGAPPAGPQLRAVPPAGASSAAAGPSPLQQYLYPPPAAGAPLSPERLREETGGAVYGPGNVLANTAASFAGAMQAVGEHTSARAFADGVRSIVERRASRVPIAPNIELYNAASGRQPPRVRLRVRGLPITKITATLPTAGSAVTQWRVNGPGTAATLKVGTMSAQQMRNAAVLAAEQKLPGVLRWTSTVKGGGVLAFAPSLALDAYEAVETDLQSGATTFNHRKFLVAEARNQSGNAVGFAGGLGIAAAVGIFVAGAPVVIVGLAGGIALQVLWNWSGAADATAGAVDQALR